MKSTFNVFSGHLLMSLNVPLTVTWRNWLSEVGGGMGTEMEMLGFMDMSRSCIVWRMVVSLLTKNSEIVLLSFRLSIVSVLLSRLWLCYSSFFICRRLRPSPADSAN